MIEEAPKQAPNETREAYWIVLPCITVPEYIEKKARGTLHEGSGYNKELRAIKKRYIEACTIYTCNCGARYWLWPMSILKTSKITMYHTCGVETAGSLVWYLNETQRMWRATR